MIVDTLVERLHVAMARIWITRPGDACHACPMVSGCPDQSSCCHLAAIEKKNPHEAKKLMEEGIIDVREKLKGYKKKRGSNQTRTQVTIQLQYHVLM